MEPGCGIGVDPGWGTVGVNPERTTGVMVLPMAGNVAVGVLVRRGVAVMGVLLAGRVAVGVLVTSRVAVGVLVARGVAVGVAVGVAPGSAAET
jgi:hypothetical protein